MKLLRRKWVKVLLAVCVLLLLIFIFRNPLMRAAGSFLVTENELTHADAILILGGNSFDRGNEALRLYDEGWSDKLLCSGGNVPSVLAALNLELKECEVTQQLLVEKGVLPEAIVLLEESTSTAEEGTEALHYCLDEGIDTLIVVSSKFHLRRVRGVFKDQFEEKGIHVLFRGAPSSQYDEDLWWKSEGGLIMVNNEYVKLFYYLFAH
jgi:uncharacterized SAM-binding protein YcdF (DUF218 family)